MEIYKDLKSTESKEFANLLSDQSSSKIEEGKIYEATITKISSKYCWVYLDAMQRGLGGASCGPDTLDRYQVGPGTYKLEYQITSGERST